MSVSLRPKTDAERATCAAAVDRIAALKGLHTAIAALISSDWKSISAAFDAARTTNDAASLAAEKATEAKNEAEGAFRSAFHQWLYSTYVPSSEKAVLKELKPLMGNKNPTRFLALAPRTILEKLPRLDAHASARPDLAGDPAKLLALRAAVPIFEAAVTVWEAALTDRKNASKDLKPAAAAFDRSYGALVRTTRSVDPNGAGELLPTFTRTRKGEVATAAPEVATEPEAETETEPQDD